MSSTDEIRGGGGTAPWTDAEVREALGLDAAQALEGGRFTGVGTDSRSLREGALFIALRGESFDGHRFLDAAAERGAPAAIVDHAPDDAPAGMHLYVVPDTLEALGRMATHRRRRLGARVCAITGTNGKTSTKEMARSVLATRYRVHATTGNLNNLVGTPLTLLTAPDDVEALVVEVGTNAPGEIARLRDIVEPDAALITTVGAGHLEGLGTIEGVLVEKTSLLEGLPEDAVTLVGDTPPSLAERARSLRDDVGVAGVTDVADDDLRAEDVRLDDDGLAHFHWRGHAVRLPVRGRHNVTNALLALGLAMEWDIGPAEAIAALAEVKLPGMRMDVQRIGELRAIVDCYNANPGSMKAGFDLLGSMPRGDGRIAVIGSMLELGEHSRAMHRETLEDALARDIDLVVATGEFALASDDLPAEAGARVLRAEDPLDAWQQLHERMQGGEVVLLKGSRGVALERLIPLLEEAYGERPRSSARGNRGRRDDAGDASAGRTVDGGGG